MVASTPSLSVADGGDPSARAHQGSGKTRPRCCPVGFPIVFLTENGDYLSGGAWQVRGAGGAPSESGAEADPRGHWSVVFGLQKYF